MVVVEVVEHVEGTENAGISVRLGDGSLRDEVRERDPEFVGGPGEHGERRSACTRLVPGERHGLDADPLPEVGLREPKGFAGGLESAPQVGEDCGVVLRLRHRRHLTVPLLSIAVDDPYADDRLDLKEPWA